MAKPVEIGERSFPSRKSAEREIRAIRDKYRDGVPLALEDDRFIRDLLSLHTEVFEKEGSGVSFFTVETETVFGGKNRHFMIHREVGPGTDFSFLHCLRPEGSDRNDRMNALRQAIKPQTRAFRDEELDSGREIVCPYESVSLNRENCQVDHDHPWTFGALVFAWLGREGLELSEIIITPPRDNQLVAQMADPRQVDSWTNFHRVTARLRLLSVRGNQSGARRRS